jgi:hypothetical protein
VAESFFSTLGFEMTPSIAWRNAGDAEPELQQFILMTAARALIQCPAPQSPGTASSASRVVEAVRPALPPQVLDAGGSRREALLERQVRSRVQGPPTLRMGAT